MDAFTYEYLQSVNLSYSVFYHVLNAVSDGAFKRKCLMEK